MSMILRVATRHLSNVLPQMPQGESAAADEVASMVTEDSRFLRTYAAKCRTLVPIFEKLAKALRAPEIDVYAARLTKRATQVDAFLPLYKQLPPLCEKLEDQYYDDLLKRLDPALPDNAILGLIQALPGFDPMAKLASQLHAQIESWVQEDSQPDFLDSYLEGYISEETGVGKRFTKIALPHSIVDEHNFVDTIYAHLNYIYDAESARERREDQDV